MWGGVDTSELNKKPTTKKRFAIISGDVDVEDRTALQDVFNSAQNMHGGVIDLLLVSSTGAEGLDLKNIRHIHIMEPYWNYGRIAQIKARGIRNDSHKALPEAEKNVQTYIYLAVPPTGEKNGEDRTTDEDLYEESVKNQTVIESFDIALKEVSIECMLNGEKNCKVCGPTNTALFSEDVQRDMRAPDPCTQVKEAQVKAEEIIVDDVKYYFIKDEKSVYDYKVFEFDKNLNGYRPMSESDPRFDKIVDEINKKKNAK
jgi:superfamily II DNA or RNA helicase